MRTLFTLLLAASLLVSCKNEEQIASQFENPPMLTPSDSVEIKQIMRPSAFFAFKDKAVIQALEDSIFRVYSLPKFEYMYSFGRRGNGPGEFLSPQSNTSSSSNSISIRSYSPTGNTFSLYAVKDNTMSETFKGEDYGFNINYNSVYQVVDDSLLVTSFISPQGEREHSLKLISLKNGLVKDIAKDFYQYTIPFKDRPNITRNEVYVTANGRNVALAYQESEHIDIYRIDKNDTFIHSATIGSPLKKSEITTDPTQMKYYYVGVLSNKDYIYAINARTSVSEMNETGQMHIFVEIYNWDGEKVSAFKLDRPNILPVFVSEKEKMIYAFNPREDFEKLIKYKLP